MKHLIELHSLRQLSFTNKLKHCMTRKHLFGIGGGISIMLIGVLLNHTEQHVVPHAVVEATGGWIHAFGAVPILRHGEKLWDILK